MDENYTQTQKPDMHSDLFGMLASQLEAEVERRVAKKCKQMLESHNLIPDGCRVLTVTYNPEEDADDPEYVKINISPSNDKEGMNDTIALILAAVKVLGKTCPNVDEEVLSDDLLGMLTDYMTGLLMKNLLGV